MREKLYIVERVSVDKVLIGCRRADLFGRKDSLTRGLLHLGTSDGGNS